MREFKCAFDRFEEMDCVFTWSKLIFDKGTDRFMSVFCLDRSASDAPDYDVFVVELMLKAGYAFEDDPDYPAVVSFLVAL